MSKVAVVYWSGTGNTEAMANEVAEGAKAAGAEVDVLTASEFGADKMDAYDANMWLNPQSWSVISGLANEAPDDDAVAACQALGKALC